MEKRSAMIKRPGGLPPHGLLLLLALLAALTFSNAAATDVYTWTDESGVVHFSDTKPPNTESRTIQTKATQGGVSYPDSSAGTPETPPAEAGDTELTAAQQRRQEITEKRQARLELAAETEALCERHRKRLEQMEPARRVYYTDENGQEVRMDDGQRVALVEESRIFVTENCQ